MAKPSIPAAIVVTPRFDVFYALYAAMGNTSSAVDEWRREAVQRLPNGFEKRARRIAPLPIFWPLLADSLQQISGEMDFEHVVGALREMPVVDLSSHILSGIFHDAGTVDSLLSRKTALRQVVAGSSSPTTEFLTHFGLRPYDSRSEAARTISTVIEHPERVRDELIALLGQFWESGFADDWAGLEPELRAEAARMAQVQKDFSFAKVANLLALPVSFDDSAREIRVRGASPIPYDRVDRCYLIPSAFNTRRWWAKYESKPGRYTLYFPVMLKGVVAHTQPFADSGSREDIQRGERNIRAEWVFRALGDTTRYAIASILARTPTSSAELARTLRVSKPTITHHVRALRSAGLITDTPVAGSTMLSLNRETVGAVSGAALEQLFSSRADLPLATTRKRRTR